MSEFPETDGLRLQPIPNQSISNQNPPKEILPAVENDTLSSSESENTQQTSFSGNPQLSPPKSKKISLGTFYKTINDATREFSQRLTASDQLNQQSRLRNSLLAIDQVKEYYELQEQRAAALAQVQSESQTSLEEWNQLMQEMQNLGKDQQQWMDEINKGNTIEQQQDQLLQNAYTDYLSALNGAGIIDQGNGIFLIPPGKEDAFNEYTQTYQSATDTFNTYWEKRLKGIEEYNAHTSTYNQQLQKLNEQVMNLIESNGLSSYFEVNPVPQLPIAPTRNLSGAPTFISIPEPISGSPATVAISSLPPYIISIGNTGTPILLTLAFVPSILSSKEMEAGLYQSLVAPIDKKMQGVNDFLSSLDKYNPNESIADPLLNYKPLALKLLPEGSVLPTHISKSIDPSNPLFSMQTPGIDQEQLQIFLGRNLIEQILQKDDNELDPKDAKELADQLSLLSLHILLEQSVEATLPTFSYISDAFSSLTRESPVFALLFTFSFSTRILQLQKEGSFEKTIQTFLDQSTQGSELSPATKQKIVGSLHQGQLSVLNELITQNLGLSGNKKSLPSKNMQEFFVNQGFTGDKADFLASVGSEAAVNGLGSPTPPAIPKPQSINQPLAANSIAAALIVDQNYSLSQAQGVSQNALNLALSDAPFSSSQTFRSALERQLHDLGVQKSKEVAAQGIIISPSPSADTTVESRVLDLLTPQIGTQMAQQVSTGFQQILAETIPNDNFKESIKTMLSFYEFSLKLMEPFSRLIHSVYFQQSHNKVDIPI
jgi:hypothetical protein